MDGFTDSMAMDVSKLQEMVKDREAWRAAVYGVAELATTEPRSTETLWRVPGAPGPLGS